MKKDTESPSEEVVFEFYEEIGEDIDEDKPLKSISHQYNKIDFEKDLNKEQLKIINNIEGPMLVIAGAGSGKTRTITYAVAKLLLSGVFPREIMLVTFTNKAAQEMIRRVKVLLGKEPTGIWAGTFHSMGNRFIRRYANMIGIKPNYNIMDQTDSRALMKLAMDEANVSEVGERFPTSSMARKIQSYSINCNKSIREVIAWKYEEFNDEKFEKKLKEVYKRYKKKKEEDGLLDFDDLLVYWNRLLEEKTVARMIARKIKYILVDEYQDTNHIQDEIIYKIAKLNPNRNVMVVGDDAQSIYAFRGANFKNILTFEEKYKNCKKYKITYNYRSVPEILDLANNSIQQNEFQHFKEMKPTRKEGIKPFLVNVTEDEEQAKFIANQVLKLRSEGFELSEMGVLFRASRHSIKIEQELQAKNIPYVVRAGVAFFEKAHIKDALAHMRIIENPYDEIAWTRIFDIIQGLGSTSGGKIFREISQMDNPLETVLQKSFFKVKMKGSRIPSKGSANLIKHLKPLAGFSQDDSPAELLQVISKLLKDYVKTRYEDAQDRLDDLEELAIYAQKYSTIRRFLETLSLNKNSIGSKSVKAGNQSENEKPLVLSTIHRAKGLEWRVIFIPMLCEGYFPSYRVSNDQESIEEERRVFYVAITRAKDQLYLIAPALVQSWDGYRTAKHSEFIEELDPETYQNSRVRFKRREHPNFRSADELLK